jgi:hypothetical protein
MNLDISSGLLDHTTGKQWQVNARTLNTNVLVVPLFDGEWPWLYPVKWLNNRIIQVTVLEISRKKGVMR